MSEDLIKQHEELKNNHAIAQSNILGLSAQLEAHKQMLNEQLNANVQLRSNTFILQKNAQDLNTKITELQKELEELKTKPAE
jgi:phosphate starvation-inducible protein PhoH